MYFVMVLLSIAACVNVVYSAVAIQLPVEKPDEMAHHDGCYLPELQRVLPYNRPYSPQDGKHCIQYTCRGDNITTIFTCGSISVDDECAVLPGDKTLPYPECCDKATCNDINHNFAAS